jgi:hypothetical protein
LQILQIEEMNNRKEEQPVVCVFGANNPRPGEEAYEYARAVGRVLGGLGYVVATGGYAGTMEAAARGAREAGGKTIGVTCRVWASRPNAYLDRVIDTADLYERARALVELGHGGYVALSGATGTLVEMALAWELMCKGLLPRRPLVCMGIFWRPLIEMISRQNARSLEFVAVAQSPDELSRYFNSLRPQSSLETPQGGITMNTRDPDPNDIARRR